MAVGDFTRLTSLSDVELTSEARRALAHYFPDPTWLARQECESDRLYLLMQPSEQVPERQTVGGTLVEAADIRRALGLAGLSSAIEPVRRLDGDSQQVRHAIGFSVQSLKARAALVHEMLGRAADLTLKRLSIPHIEANAIPAYRPVGFNGRRIENPGNVLDASERFRARMQPTVAASESPAR